jgi:hypothetical protein
MEEKETQKKLDEQLPQEQKKEEPPPQAQPPQEEKKEEIMPPFGPETPVEITVTKGRSIPGPTQYTSERVDYTLKMTTTIQSLPATRQIIENTINMWLPKMPDQPPQQETKQPSQPTPAAAPQPQPFLETVKQKMLPKLTKKQLDKLKFSLDEKGHAIVQPTFLGDDFKPVATAVKDTGYETDYVGEGSGKHWIIYNPRPQAAPVAPAQVPDATLNPDDLAKLPWRKYHESSPNAWIFANTPGAEALFTMLKQQRDEQHIDEVPVLIGGTWFDCKLGKDKEKPTEDKFINRTLPK